MLWQILRLNQLTVCQVMDWSSHGLANLRTSQLAEMFDAKFGKDYRIGTARCTTFAEEATTDVGWRLLYITY